MTGAENVNLLWQNRWFLLRGTIRSPRSAGRRLAHATR